MKENIRVDVNCHEPIRQVQYKAQMPVITLVGQPNSGKTSLFNVLTNSNYKTANYPGATVEYSAGNLINKFNTPAVVLDSPGIISINPRSPDEEVTINALFKHPKFGYPDAVIVTLDCTQLSRQLFLAKQLINSGFNTIIAITMHDLLRKKKLDIDVKKLEKIIGCPVVIINSREGKGIDELVNKTISSFSNEDFLKSTLTHLLHNEKNIVELYKFTEDAEKNVIFSRNGVDINNINEKVFNSINRKPDERTLRLDKIFLHPLFGLIIFIIAMGIIFTSIFWIAQPLMYMVDSLFVILSDTAIKTLPVGTWYTDLVTNGLINGIGSVAIFLPQIIILFIFLGLLEDTGYLARSAMIIDKPLSWFGLNGRSFIPMLSGYACAIPAMMSARTITNRRERLLTIFIIPLMSCSARLPVYALLLAFIVPPDKPWIAGIALGGLYLLSLIAGSVTAGLISKFKKSKGNSTFMLELPAYRKPIFRHVIKNTLNKSVSYLKSAGPMIIGISLVLWFLTYFPNSNPEISPDKLTGLSEEQTTKLIESERLNNSFSSYMGKVIEPILKPAGWDWRIGISLMSAFAAREVFVSAMALTLTVTDADEDNLQMSLVRSMQDAKFEDTQKPLFTVASTAALIVFFMFAMQCLSTVAVSRKETGSWKIPILQLSVYTPLALILAIIIFNGLKFIGIN